RFLQMRPGHCYRVVFWKGNGSCQTFIEHTSKRIDVRASVEGLSLDLLGSAVVNCSCEPTMAGDSLICRKPFCKAEVREIRVRLISVRFFRDQDVGRLHVAMYKVA